MLVLPRDSPSGTTPCSGGASIVSDEPSVRLEDVGHEST
jgi:hypothetical protein